MLSVWQRWKLWGAHYLRHLAHGAGIGAFEIQPEVGRPSARIPAGGRGAGCQFRRRNFDAGFSEETGGENGVEGGWHGYDGQVFGADAAVLAGHVRMERVSRFGNGAA